MAWKEISTTSQSNDQLSMILYSFQVFGSYVEPMDKDMIYELEYLVAGQKRDKDNFSSVVQRILAVRLVVNYLYVSKNQEFLKKSLATAGTIVALTKTEPLLKAVQQVILLILSLEESCVDVQALLQGKSVPFLKKRNNFQMTYEEICMGSRQLFSEKAKKLQDGNGVRGKSGVFKGELEYGHYLWIFLLLGNEDKLATRIAKLIDDDLQKKYNATFAIENCICGIKGQVYYQVPFLFKMFWMQSAELENTQQGNLRRQFSIQYAYQ